MRLFGLLRPLHGAFRGRQGEASAILISSALLMTTWKYFGSPAFFSSRLAPLFGLEDAPAAGAVYSFAAFFLLLGVAPAAMVKFGFRRRLSDYGVAWGDWRLGLGVTLAAMPVIVLAVLVGPYEPSLNPEYPTVAQEYPLNPSACASPGAFAFHAAAYAMLYVGCEFHLRGYLLFGLRDAIGESNALWLQMLAGVLLHIGKPTWETFASLAASFFWGLLALRTRSLLYGMIQHYLLGVMLDCVLCAQMT